MNKLKKECNVKTNPAELEKEFKPESCRICLTRNDKMSNVFTRKLIEKIKYCTGIKIKKDDGLPTKICKSCQTSLIVAHKFKKLCVLTEQICQNVLESKIKTEVTETSKSLANKSNEDYFNNGWLKQDQSNNNLNGDCVNKDNLNGDNVKRDHSINNFKEDCVKEDDCNHNFNEDQSDDDNFNKNFNGDHVNDDNDDVINDVSVQGSGLTVVKKEEVECEFEVSTEDVPEELLNNLEEKSCCDRPRRQPKPRKFEEIIGNIKPVRKKRGPYRKKTELPKRRKKFKYFKLFCETCQLKFTCKKESDEHRESFHKEAWSTMCEVCGKLFAHRGSYTSHVRSHRPPSHFCEHCDYRTANKYDLAKHLLIHAGTKKYQCSQCPNTYYTSSNLREHEKMIHERLLRYACDICGKMFYDRTHLRRHVDSHNDVKRFECQMCHTAFTRRCYWKKHLLKQHSITVPAQRPGRVSCHAVVTDAFGAPDAADDPRRLLTNVT